MESSWRWNVAEQGWAGIEVKYLARLLTPGFGDWMVGFSVGTVSYGFGVNTVFLPSGEQQFQYVSGPYGERFPYGFKVEPD